jgi:hypothetical protein
MIVTDSTITRIDNSAILILDVKTLLVLHIVAQSPPASKTEASALRPPLLRVDMRSCVVRIKRRRRQTL